MQHRTVTDSVTQQLSEYVTKRMGLHFPRERWPDLQRGLAGAITELGFSDLIAGAEWLLSAHLTKAELDVLASHLTVGETYFFREQRAFEILREKIMPALIQERRNGNRRLRIWSAACCTGEEPYSLAILLSEMIHDLPDWNLNILATDINSRFLKKAIAGDYRDWSFRGTSKIKDRYFKRGVDGSYALTPEIKRLVTFSQLNLVEDSFPSLAAETNAMDLIFCRNVLMYFSPAQARRVVSNLYRALVDGGWLVVSPSETSQTLFSQFTTVNFPGLILYRKTNQIFQHKQTEIPARNEKPFIPFVYKHKDPPISTRPERGSFELARSFYEQGLYAKTVELLLPVTHVRKTVDSKTFSLLARALADQGKLNDAVHWCDCWTAAEKLNASAHYLRAIVLQELGEVDQSRLSLQRAIYIDPGFVLAHFALGNLARARGNLNEARKNFANALSLLRSLTAHEVLPESDGLTAARLTEIITAITSTEETP